MIFYLICVMFLWKFECQIFWFYDVLEATIWSFFVKPSSSAQHIFDGFQGLRTILRRMTKQHLQTSIRPIHIFCWLSRSAFNLAIRLGICLGEKNLSIWHLFELGHLIWPHQDLFTLSSFYILQILVINMTPRWCVSDRLPSWIYSSSQTPEILRAFTYEWGCWIPP